MLAGSAAPESNDFILSDDTTYFTTYYSLHGNQRLSIKIGDDDDDAVDNEPDVSCFMGSEHHVSRLSNKRREGFIKNIKNHSVSTRIYRFA